MTDFHNKKFPSENQLKIHQSYQSFRFYKKPVNPPLDSPLFQVMDFIKHLNDAIRLLIIYPDEESSFIH